MDWTGRDTLACAGYLLLLLLVLLGNEEVKTLNLDDLIDLKIISASQTSPLLHAVKLYHLVRTKYPAYRVLLRVPAASGLTWLTIVPSYHTTTLRTRAKITRAWAVIGQHVIDSSK